MSVLQIDDTGACVSVVVVEEKDFFSGRSILLLLLP